jgi:hypothetical protein
MPDFDLVPIDHDPFGGSNPQVPFYTNPSVDDLLARGRAPTSLPGASLTNQPSWMDTAGAAAGQFVKGGLSEVLKNAGVQLPEASNRVSDFMQSEPVNTAIGMTTPLKGAGVIQEAMSAAKPSITAYHGSPHDFDKFNVRKSNQGLWFADDPNIAEHYKFGNGKVYEVKINAPIESFIHRNKPISEQSEPVRSALAGIAKEFDIPYTGNGGDLYFDLSRKMAGEGPFLQGIVKANDVLRQRGIPGITQGDTHVVFDDKLIDILKKYGIAGIGALPAMGAYHFKDSDLKQ